MLCRHCGKRIIKVNTALGENWYHQPEGASNMDNVNMFCQVTIAEPQGTPYIPKDAPYDPKDY